MERFRHMLGARALLTLAASLLAGPVAAQADDSAGDSPQVTTCPRIWFGSGSMPAGGPDAVALARLAETR
jgi:hypothetical protein